MKKTFKVFLLSLMTGFVGLTTLGASIAWFLDEFYIQDQISGSSFSDYYAGGTGIKGDPFIITKPRHLYNFAWLQYKGAYTPEPNDPTKGVVGTDVKESDITYFRIDADIDMSIDFPKTALPPIGTTVNPFVGILDGNKKNIKNLWISSDPDDWKITPIGYDSTTIGSDIGVFGYILKGEKTVSGVPTYFGGTISDFYLENVIVTSNVADPSKNTSGLVVGYLNGSCVNVGVKNGKLDFKSTGKSNYSLVGDMDASVTWIDRPTDGGVINSDLRVIPSDYTTINAGSSVSVKNAPEITVGNQSVPIASIEGSVTVGTISPKGNIYKLKNQNLQFGQSYGIPSLDSSVVDYYSTNSRSSDLEPEFWQAIDGNKGLKPNGSPNFSGNKPTNCIWFQPQSNGLCAMAFLPGNMGGDGGHMSIYRFTRTNGVINNPSDSDRLDLVFLANQSGGNKLKNGDIVYYEFKIEKGYEYCISKTVGHNDTSTDFIFLKLGGAAEGGENAEQSYLLKIDYMESIPTAANRNSSTLNIWGDDYVQHNIIWTVLSAQSGAWIQYDAWSSDKKVHICHNGTITISKVGTDSADHGTDTTGFTILPLSGT